MWHLITVRLNAAILFAIACMALFVQPHAPAQTAFSSFGDNSVRHHTQVELLLSADTTKPGDTVFAGVDMKMDPGWHTYWKNPGDSGSPTKIEWTLPSGVTAGEIQWPLPQKLPPAEVTTYGYEDETVLIVPLTLGKNLDPGPLNLSAKVSWLECKESCIPANQTVEAKLTIGSESKPSADAATIDMWKSKMPQTDRLFSFQAGWEKPASGDTRPLIISGSQTGKDLLPVHDVDFYPDASDQIEVEAATEKIAEGAGFRLRKTVKKISGDWPTNVSGLIVVSGSYTPKGFEFQSPISENAPGAQSVSTTSSIPPSPAQPLWQMLIFAFIGGLILNLMPCVLPVIALKILGFVGEAHSEPRRVRKLGFVYTLGVLASFMTLAGIDLGVKAAGHHAGWGMQFGSPVFVVCLTTLVLLVALNLFGVFEVTLGGRAFDTASELASRSGAGGAFFNGVLATTLATPCTAPFLGTALGFASQQSASVIVLIFLTVGLGLSAPYVILSCQPAWLKFLPKPGAWMEKFKIAMGFPMLATVVWLFNVAAADYGTHVFWLGAFLVIVAFAAWIFGEFFQRSGKRKGIAIALVLILLGGGYAWALENRLHWREMPAETNAGSKSSGEVNWESWSPEAVTAARAAGKPVLVDFTATWCVTCNAIIKPALDNSSISAKLKDLNGVAMLADYTRTPPEMTKVISDFGGAGVPLVLVYPKDPEAPAIVLPQPSPLQLPSSYSKIVLDALDRAK